MKASAAGSTECAEAPVWKVRGASVPLDYVLATSLISISVSVRIIRS